MSERPPRASRRALLAGAAVSAAAGCARVETNADPRSSAVTNPTGATQGGPSAANQPSTNQASTTPSSANPSTSSTGTTIGDGSTSNTGPQPHQPTWQPLKPGQRPPQFVVISWDGAAETDSHLNSHFQSVASSIGAAMTFFVSGIYFLPGKQRNLYHAPHHQPGASDIGWLPERFIHATIELVGKAWLAGHEVGTHFNGHFCGPRGVQTWSVADWRTEIAYVNQFVTTWRTTTGFTDLPPLPFDQRTALVGGRAPCLEGAPNLRKAAASLGWRYDSSSTRFPRWPLKVDGVWDLSMQQVPFPAHSFEVTAMDYNFMANQSGTVHGDKRNWAAWRKQTVDALTLGFWRSYNGNRSPLIIGNHFEGWNGGIYMQAVEEVMLKLAKYPDVRFVSFKQLCDWLDVQQPATLLALQKLSGQPPGGWAEFGG